MLLMLLTNLFNRSPTPCCWIPPTDGDGIESHTHCHKDHQLDVDSTFRDKVPVLDSSPGVRAPPPGWQGRGTTLLPELHACAPRADVLPQKQVVEGHSVDHVEKLLEHLQDDLGVQALVAHDCVKGVHLADDGFQAVGVVPVHHAGGALAVARWLHTRETLNALIF